MSEVNEEYHVASFVAQVAPAELDSRSKLLDKFDGTEVHASSPQGKIVFTVEGESQKAIALVVDEIRLTDAFLSISPVYHQFLTEPQAIEVN
ncbi:chaperone NapD [Thalassotalea euphylliae]|uniref:chaperone NapD n=1 Tax=Thalassotalea euphylliae TaxID=1655234 RepID=UPI00362DFC2D